MSALRQNRIKRGNQSCRIESHRVIASPLIKAEQPQVQTCRDREVRLRFADAQTKAPLAAVDIRCVIE